LKKNVSLKVDTPTGKATITEVFITELGHLMAKVFYAGSKHYVNHKIGEIGELASTANIHMMDPISRRISVKKGIV
jgi:hypothetical protein